MMGLEGQDPRNKKDGRCRSRGPSPFRRKKERGKEEMKAEVELK